MYCPYCGTKNVDDATVCVNTECQRSLPQRKPKPMPQSSPESFPVQPKPASPIVSSATIGSLSGLVGGGTVLLGWFLPWLELGIGRFSLVSSGNGPQVVMGLLTVGVFGGGLADLLGQDAGGLLFFIVSLILVAIVLIVPIYGFLAALNGWRLFIKSTSNGSSVIAVAGYTEEIRRRLLVVVILTAIVFVAASFVSLGALGKGFWITAAGALGGFLAALYTQAQLRKAKRSS